MVATKALTGSTKLACVNVATVALLSETAVVVIGADTEMAPSATVVLALALLSDVFGSEDVADTEAELVVTPSSIAWTFTDSLIRLPTVTVPMLNVTTPFDWLKVP